MSADTLTKTTHNFNPLPGKSGLPEPTLQAVSDGNEKPTLVIGDIHGHLDRLEALLRQEGLLDICAACDGGAFDYEPCGLCEGSCEHDRWSECSNCNGDGWARTDKPATVVLLGDVGHFGMTKIPPHGEKKPASATADMLSWQAAAAWADIILWGNHDRAVFEPWHRHDGYLAPFDDTVKIMLDCLLDGKLKLAYAAHGFLMTHAGLALAFKDQPIDDHFKKDVNAFADWINQVNDPDAEIEDPNLLGIRDAIGKERGGSADVGGILWRDVNEKLYPFRQVFGHSADHKEREVRYCTRHSFTRNPCAAIGFENMSYCIDIGGPDEWGKTARCIAGIWLPEERIVRVDL